MIVAHRGRMRMKMSETPPTWALVMKRSGFSGQPAWARAGWLGSAASQPHRPRAGTDAAASRLIRRPAGSGHHQTPFPCLLKNAL
jgi:hypothetical protein